jgi:hypothetical protein
MWGSGFPMCPSTFFEPNPLLFLHKNEVGDLKLLSSHVLAGLNIVHEDDLDPTKRPTWAEVPEMRRILKDAAYRGVEEIFVTSTPPSKLLGALRTALGIAVYKRNRAAVEMILESRKFEDSTTGCNIGMIPNDKNDAWCMIMAESLGEKEIARLLLEKGEADIGPERLEALNKKAGLR